MNNGISPPDEQWDFPIETDITSVMSLSSLIVIPIVDWLELLLRASQCLLVSKAREANHEHLYKMKKKKEATSTVEPLPSTHSESTYKVTLVT